MAVGAGSCASRSGSRARLLDHTRMDIHELVRSPKALPRFPRRHHNRGAGRLTNLADLNEARGAAKRRVAAIWWGTSRRSETIPVAIPKNADDSASGPSLCERPCL